ncbi:MAG: nucleotidyltransferase domain-containing protein [Verrucomicrobiales bacterium]
MIPPSLNIPDDALREFCAKHHIRTLKVFGSALREDFTPESDIDLLAEFAPDEPLGLIRLGTIEAELSEILGRRVDLNLPSLLSKYFRDEVLAVAETIYDAA